MPSAESLLTVMDRGAQRTMRDAKAAVDPIVSLETPRSSGDLADKLRGKVTRTQTGYGLTVGVPRGARDRSGATLADVARWVQRGTGIHREGPGPKRRIRSKRPLGRMTLPGGKKVRSVAGQRADPFMQRIHDKATPRVDQIVQEGALATARDTERLARP